MELSRNAEVFIGITLISIPTVEYGGYFLLTQLRKATAIKSDLQWSYFRAGHAHAGVLVILSLIAQLLVDTVGLAGAGEFVMRVSLVAAPILVSAGFFGGAPREGTQPAPLIVLVYIGALLLAGAMIVLGLGLVF